MRMSLWCGWYPFAGTAWLPTYVLLWAVSINLTFVIVFLCTQMNIEQRQMHLYKQRGDALESKALKRFKQAMLHKLNTRANEKGQTGSIDNSVTSLDVAAANT